MPPPPQRNTTPVSFVASPARTDPVVVHPRVMLAGAPVDLMTREDAIATIMSAAAGSTSGEPPLGVASANLDHLHHFGRRGRWRQTFRETGGVRWLTLLDGHPLVTRVRYLCGRSWPCLPGSGLIEELLERAEDQGVSVGFLGGTEEAQERLRARVAQRWPRLVVSGYWAPERAAIVEPDRARELARAVAGAGPQMVFVGLGKPRQELWIAEYGAATGAGVLLAFGASADFVSGIVQRAPALITRFGLEWLWRLLHEPKRLARRYLAQGLRAYPDLWLHSERKPHPTPDTVAQPAAQAQAETARVTAIVVTYNSEAHVGQLLQDLAALDDAQQVRVLVVDNGSRDATRDIVRQAGVELIETHANLGYAGAINVGLAARGDCDAVLVLNADLRIETDALDSMWRLLRSKDAAAVVPRILDADGQPYESLRFEPSLLGGLGDALLGSRAKTRPPWLADIDRDPQSYQFPHPVDWATGAVILIAEQAVREVGSWNEDFFLYCEETDFFRRLRDTGGTVWFDPSAQVRHDAHGSGSAPELDALMAVNRVRYAQLHRGTAYAVAMRAVATLAELVRVSKGVEHRRALRYLLDRSSWERLPRADPPRESAGGAPS